MRWRTLASWSFTASLIAIVGGGIYLTWWLPRFLNDLYGQWATAEMVIHFHETEGHLPTTWDELLPFYDEATHAANVTKDKLGSVIGVDFGMLKIIEQRAKLGGSRENLPEAIYTRSGRQSCWGGAEPNELLFDYFKEKGVARWFPETDEVPSNALKFYLVFSEPMTTGNIYQHIQLIDDETEMPVAGAFREVELWSPDAKRLTVWLHPGRQKQGVKLNEEEGRVLVEDKDYTLKLSHEATTARGNKLPSDVTLSFTAVAPDHDCPDPSQWTVTPPRIDENDRWPSACVEVSFHATMDWAMLHTALKADVPGTVVVEEVWDGSDWRFYPDKPWKPGKHTIEVTPELEDLSGNNLIRPFEADASAKPSATPAKPVILEFEVTK